MTHENTSGTPDTPTFDVTTALQAIVDADGDLSRLRLGDVIAIDKALADHEETAGVETLTVRKIVLRELARRDERVRENVAAQEERWRRAYVESTCWAAFNRDQRDRLIERQKAYTASIRRSEKDRRTATRALRDMFGWSAEQLAALDAEAEREAEREVPAP